MRTILLILAIISFEAKADYSKFISCYFNDHAFTQSVAQYIHEQSKQGNAVVFDSKPGGFASKKTGELAFYLDYSLGKNCFPDWVNRVATCEIRNPDIVFGKKPTRLDGMTKYYQDMWGTLDSMKLSSFLDSVGLFFSENPIMRLEIGSLGSFLLESEIDFESTAWNVDFIPMASPPPAFTCSTTTARTAVRIRNLWSSISLNSTLPPTASGATLIEMFDFWADRTGSWKERKYVFGIPSTIQLSVNGLMAGRRVYDWGCVNYLSAPITSLSNTGVLVLPTAADNNGYYDCAACFSSASSWIGSGTETVVELSNIVGITNPNDIYVDEVDMSGTTVLEFWLGSKYCPVTQKDVPVTCTNTLGTKSFTVVVRSWNHCNMGANTFPVQAGTYKYNKITRTFIKQ